MKLLYQCNYCNKQGSFEEIYKHEPICDNNNSNSFSKINMDELEERKFFNILQLNKEDNFHIFNNNIFETPLK